MMEFPKNGEDWDSRFMDFLAKRQYKAFRKGYVAKVQTEFAVQLNHWQELKNRKTIAVTNNKRLFTKASANVVANGTSVEQFAHLKTTFAQLAKSEADEREAEDRLESLQFEKDEKVSGTKDPENMEWIRNLEVINESNEASKAAFIAELDKRLDSMPDMWWDEITNGSNRKSKWLAESVCHFATYYDQNFTETELGILFGVVTNNHNIRLAIKKLVYLRMMKASTDGQGSVVYGLVDTLIMYLRYEAEVDDSIAKDLDWLYREGNAIINERKRKRESETSDDDNSDKGNSKSKEDEEDEVTVMEIEST